MDRIQVRTEPSYDVVVGAGILADIGDLMPKFEGAKRAFVVSDRVVTEAYLGPIAKSVEATGLTVVHLGVPEGEAAKTLQVAETLYRLLAAQEAHRGEPIIAVGGGAVGDVAGFVAATYVRGLPVVQVPTTLTAQVDAAIGGKTAVDLPEGKNLVGAFHQPSLVIADVDTLTSLSDRDFRSGLGEVAKYAVTLDATLLALLQEQLRGVHAREPEVMEQIVARSAAAKARIVAEDERDHGARLVLNYGHTLAHAIERIEGYQGRTHGEAVAVGMVFAGRLAVRLAMAPEAMASEHERLFESLGLDVGGAMPPVDVLMDSMRQDKKYQDGLRFVLLRGTGDPDVVHGVPEDAIRATLAGMGSLT